MYRHYFLKKWDKAFIEKTLQKLVHMGYEEKRPGAKGAIHFKKLKDWEYFPLS